MIRITVTGQTYDIRESLKRNKFRWIPVKQAWIKIVGEGSLDHTINAIRPMKSWSETPCPKITLTLQVVDIEGLELSPNEFKMKLLDVERPGSSVLEEFRKEGFSDIHVSPTCPGPIDPKDKKPKNVDEAFF